jgi:hypothetical protein
MTEPARRDGPGVLKMLIVIVGALLLAFYAFVVLTSRDPLWFVRRFEDQPSHIVVYHAGQRAYLLPGDAGFDALADAVQSSLAQGFARLSNVGFSEQSLQEAFTQHVTLEAFFDRPITLHTWFYTGRTTQLLFPITGRHSDLSVVLLGDEGQYRVGAPVLKTMEPIQDTLRSLGYY